jgi:hypothetical protein
VQEGRVEPVLGQTRIIPGGRLGGAGLPEVLDQETGGEEQGHPGPERSVKLVKREGDPIALHVIDRPLGVEIGPLLGGVAAHVRGGKRMHDRRGKPTARNEHPGRLPKGSCRVIHVLKGHEGDDQVELALTEWERGRVGHDNVFVGAGPEREVGQRCGGIDSGDPVSCLLQSHADTSLAAAEVKRGVARTRNQLPERRPVVAVEMVVVARGAGPAHPGVSLRRPLLSQRALAHRRRR